MGVHIGHNYQILQSVKKKFNQTTGREHFEKYVKIKNILRDDFEFQWFHVENMRLKTKRCEMFIPIYIPLPPLNIIYEFRV